MTRFSILLAVLAVLLSGVGTAQKARTADGVSCAAIDNRPGRLLTACKTTLRGRTSYTSEEIDIDMKVNELRSISEAEYQRLLVRKERNDKRDAKQEECVAKAGDDLDTKIACHQAAAKDTLDNAGK
jgi:hypothetical protein